MAEKQKAPVVYVEGNERQGYRVVSEAAGPLTGRLATKDAAVAGAYMDVQEDRTGAVPVPFVPEGTAATSRTSRPKPSEG